MAKTTAAERVDLDAELEAQISAMTDEQVDELYEGAPASFSDPGPESPVHETPAIAASDPSPADMPEVAGKVHLVNLRYNNELIFLSENGKWTGTTVQFTDGHLIVDPDVAAQVKAACPYVYEEPKEGPVYTYEGFSTRSPAGYAEYVKQYHANL